MGQQDSSVGRALWDSRTAQWSEHYGIARSRFSIQNKWCMRFWKLSLFTHSMKWVPSSHTAGEDEGREENEWHPASVTPMLAEVCSQMATSTQESWRLSKAKHFELFEYWQCIYLLWTALPALNYLLNRFTEILINGIRNDVDWEDFADKLMKPSWNYH